MEDTDVVVVGAGLAGLRCARRLGAAGLEVVLVERSDRVGGRVRTDVVDGHLVDHGFQLLNPSYPAVRRWVDVPALGLSPFPAGVSTARGAAQSSSASKASGRWRMSKRLAGQTRAKTLPTTSSTGTKASESSHGSPLRPPQRSR